MSRKRMRETGNRLPAFNGGGLREFIIRTLKTKNQIIGSRESSMSMRLKTRHHRRPKFMIRQESLLLICGVCKSGTCLSLESGVVLQCRIVCYVAMSAVGNVSAL